MQDIGILHVENFKRIELQYYAFYCTLNNQSLYDSTYTFTLFECLANIKTTLSNFLAELSERKKNILLSELRTANTLVEFSKIHATYKKEKELTNWANSLWDWFYKKTGYVFKKEQ